MYERIAIILGWPPEDVKSLSLASLRDLVALQSTKLAREISSVIATGRILTSLEEGFEALTRPPEVTQTWDQHHAQTRSIPSPQGEDEGPACTPEAQRPPG